MAAKAAPAFFLLCLGSPELASAQRATELETGSHIPIPRRARIDDTSGVSKVDQSRLSMAQFARCVVDRRASAVQKMLKLSADKVDASVIATLADDDCLASGQMAFSPLLFRGALFAELYRRRAASEGRGLVWNMGTVPFDPRATVDGTADATTKQGRLLVFASCVVGHDAGTAKSVVLAPPTSKSQNDAFAVLTPQLGQCLFQDQQISLTKIVLEGALGEVLYRGIVPADAEQSRETK